ncbi:hypothetical protein [Streptomyces sp. NPDC050255]|uniref:hypothetical protein n=1 Tax=Streptomyces sp. NPDC050255 TaxID=3365606 RepID=UPI0037975A4C
MASVGLSVIAVLLSVFNLLLLYGVIRRLKERPPRAAPDEALLAPGTAVELPAGERPSPTLVGFFAPGCGPCDELLPSFAAYASSHPGGRERVRVVLYGEPGEPRYTQALGPVAGLVPAEAHPLWTAAFRTSAYPQVHALSPAGVVLWSAGSAAELAARVRA